MQGLSQEVLKVFSSLQGLFGQFLLVSSRFRKFYTSRILAVSKTLHLLLKGLEKTIGFCFHKDSSVAYKGCFCFVRVLKVLVLGNSEGLPVSFICGDFSRLSSSWIPKSSTGGVYVVSV